MSDLRSLVVPVAFLVGFAVTTFSSLLTTGKPQLVASLVGAAGIAILAFAATLLKVQP